MTLKLMRIASLDRVLVPVLAPISHLGLARRIDQSLAIARRDDVTIRVIIVGTNESNLPTKSRIDLLSAGTARTQGILRETAPRKTSRSRKRRSGRRRSQHDLQLIVGTSRYL